MTFIVLMKINYCIIGRKFKKKYQLGDNVKILVAKANLVKKQLDFELVSDFNV